MPRYRFVAAFEHVLMDLEHDIEAIVHRADGSRGGPAGSTVILGPGDILETEEPYTHPHLEALPEQQAPVQAPAAPAAVEAPVQAPVTDPAPAAPAVVEQVPVQTPVDAPVEAPAAPVEQATAQPVA